MTPPATGPSSEWCSANVDGTHQTSSCSTGAWYRRRPTCLNVRVFPEDWCGRNLLREFLEGNVRRLWRQEQSLTDQWVSIRSMGLKFLGLFTGFSNLGLKFMGLFMGLMFVWRVWFFMWCSGFARDWGLGLGLCSLYFVDMCPLILRVPCWHALDFFNFLSNQTYYLRKNMNMFFMMIGKNIM